MQPASDSESELDEYITSKLSRDVGSHKTVIGPNASLPECLSEAQMRRYEVFRRANLNKANIKKLANGFLHQNVNQNISIVIAGFSKVFIGEIVELALDIKDRSDNNDPLEPLTPQHLREAYRQYQLTKTISGKRKRIVKFLR